MMLQLKSAHRSERKKVKGDQKKKKKCFEKEKE